MELGNNGPINLRKSEVINLRKSNPGLKVAEIGMSWLTNKYSGTHDFDLDVTTFMKGANGKVLGNAYFIGYYNPKSPDGAVIYGKDNQKGKKVDSKERYEETVKIIFDLLPNECEEVDVVVTIDEFEERGQTFGMVDDAFVEVVNAESGKIEYRYDLNEEFSVQTGVLVTRFSRSKSNRDDWTFRMVGEGYAGGLDAFCVDYGMNVTRE